VTSNGGEPEFEIYFDARDITEPGMLQWVRGPLEEALALAPYRVRVLITRLEWDELGE
jgi:hypothetical protein